MKYRCIADMNVFEEIFLIILMTLFYKSAVALDTLKKWKTY